MPYQAKIYLRSIAVLLIMAGIFALPLRGAQPLSKDDITLLLIGGASESKMITLVEQRGVDFQLTPDLIQQFRKEGATQAVIDAIVNANRKSVARSTGPAVQTPPPATSSESGINPEIPGLGGSATNISSPPPAASQPQPSSAAAVNQKVSNVMSGLANGPEQAEAPPPLAPASKQAAATPASNTAG